MSKVDTADPPERPDNHEDGRRLEVCARLSTYAAKGLSQGAALRMDAGQTTNDARSREMARVAVSRLDLLAGQRRGSATQSP